MKKLLTVLLTVLMACSILTVNVFAEDEEVIPEVEEIAEVVEEQQKEEQDELEEKPVLVAAPLAAAKPKTVEIGVVISDYGTGSGGLIARDCQLKGMVEIPVDNSLIDIFGNFELEDIQDAIIQAAKDENYIDSSYQVLFFGQYYEENIWWVNRYTNTCSIWDYVGLLSGKQIKNIELDTKQCYLVFEKVPAPTAPQPSDATAAELTANGEAQKLLAEPYPTVPAEVADTCKVVYSLDGKVWSDSVPEAKEAGDYVVYYRTEAKDGTSYKPSEPKYVEVTIKKAPLTMTAHFKLIKSEKGLGPLRQIANECTLLNDGKEIEVANVPVKSTALGTYHYYRLTDESKELGVSESLLAAVKANCPEEYEFLMFGQTYSESLHTCGVWVLRDLFIPSVFGYGEEIRNVTESETCYIVYVKKDVTPSYIPVPTGAVAATSLTYNGSNQALLDASSDTKVIDSKIAGAAKDVDYVIKYSLNGVDGWTEDPTEMVALEAGDHKVYYRAEPIIGRKYDGFLASNNAELTVTIAPFEAEQKDGDNGNTSVEITGPNEDGTKVEFEVTVELPSGEKTISSDDPDFDDFFEVVDDSDEPTKFGENTLVLKPQGNLSGDPIEVKYNVGHVADSYEAWDSSKRDYCFPVDTNEENELFPLPHKFNYYTTKTPEGYAVTVARNLYGLAVIARSDVPLGDIYTERIEGIPTPKAKVEVDYFFVVGKHENILLKYADKSFSELIDAEVVDQAELIVYSESAYETGETDEKHDGEYVYEGTDTDAEVGEKDVIKFIVEPAQEIIDEGIDESYDAIGTVDAYLVLYRWNEDKDELDSNGVRVELKNKAMIKIVVKELFKDALAKLDVDDPLEKGYRRDFAIFHMVDGKPQLKTLVSAEDEVTYWTDSCSYFTLAYKNVKKPTPYTPVVTGVE